MLCICGGFGRPTTNSIGFFAADEVFLLEGKVVKIKVAKTDIPAASC
jgi:hypothetical protein